MHDRPNEDRHTLMPASQPDLRKLARRQRWVSWLLLAVVAFYAGALSIGMSNSGFAMGVARGARFGTILVKVLTVVGVVLVLRAKGERLAIVITFGFLSITPCADVMILLLVNVGAIQTLRRAGLRAGFMGVKARHVDWLLNPDLCSGCGYNLTGNTSGCCPECGRSIDPSASASSP